MDASKIVSRIQKISANNEYAKSGSQWIWRVEATNQKLVKSDGSFFIGTSEDPTPYFEGRVGMTDTYAEAKAAVDARVAEVRALPDAE